MAWIKRNLFFVLSLAAGLILTGYCAWLFRADYNANEDVNKEYAEDVQKLDELQKKPDYASKENIAKAQEETKQVKQVLSDLRNTFTPFPPPPKVDDKGFSAYLEDTISELRTKATNSQVALPDNFAFGFTDLRDKISFPAANIPLWMGQLAEIKAICGILYGAQINSIVWFKRAAVNPTDQFNTPNDSFGARIVNQPMLTVTPYKIEFRAFTLSLAAVMERLAKSSNCFVVKNVVVVPAGQRVLDQPQAAALQNEADIDPGAMPTLPRIDRMSPLQAQQLMEDYRKRMAEYRKRKAATEEAARLKAAHLEDKGPAVTVEKEQLLYITLSVDVIKLN
jgi:hypothetical protein